MSDKPTQIWSPKTHGLITFTPSPTGSVIAVKADGSKFKHPANRAERRRLLREERRRQKHELLQNRKSGLSGKSEVS